MGGPEIKLKRIFPEFKWIFYDFNNNRKTRRKLFRYASNDCVCEFISETWEWLHEASSRVSDRICNRKKKREDKISLYLRADLSPAHRACSTPTPRLIIVFSNI